MKTNSQPITLLDVALSRGLNADDSGGYSGDEFQRVGVPFFCGCELCGSSIVATKACPAVSGFIRCIQCVSDSGFESVEDFEKWHDEYYGEEYE